jgi:hypothetical protein
MEEPLAATVVDLIAHMATMDNAVGVCKEDLKRQFNTRLMRANNDGFKYSSIGPEYRAKTKKKKGQTKKKKVIKSDNRNELE